MRPIADDGVICELAKPLDTASDLHRREIRMTFNPGFFDSQSGVLLEKLSFRDQLSEKRGLAHDTYTTDQTLGILIHRAFFGELKFILEYPHIHVGVVVSTERSLHRTISKYRPLEVERTRTVPTNISYNIVPKFHQSTSKL